MQPLQFEYTTRELFGNHFPYYVAEFNRMQKKKMDYLIKTGGNFSGDVTAYIGFPDGRLATIDPFGRVTWKAT